MQAYDNLMQYSDLFPRLVILNAVVAHCASDWSWDLEPGVRRGYDLWLILQGQGNLESHGQPFTLKAGDCFLLRLWQKQYSRQNPQRPLTIPYIIFDFVDEHGSSIVPDLGEPALHYRLRKLDFFVEIVNCCIAAHREGRKNDALHWLTVALLELQNPRNQPMRNEQQSSQASTIEEICQTIRRFPGARPTIPELASECAWSADHFTRIFSKHKGMTPGEFMIRVRLEEADSLLLFSNHSVARIAQILGYSDEFAFSHQFKSRRGMSPKYYRDSLLRAP